MSRSNPLPPLLSRLGLPLLGLVAVLSAEAAPADPRPLRDLYGSYFPIDAEGTRDVAAFTRHRAAVRERVLLASGLLPLPTKTPLNAVVHGRVERDDYTIDRVFFESFPGHYVCGNLYLPKNPPPGARLPGILCPHGHWPNGRFMDLGAGTAATKEQLAIGAERFESGARSPLQARCVQLARMGCAVFFYDMLGYADSVQIVDHRTGRRPELDGTEPGTFGLYSTMADLQLQSNFGLQTWNSVRALDFLLTVPGIDPTRISCTGASGGGTQTLVLGAIDDRLATAFPCVMTSTAMQGGCTCENANYLRINQGNIDLAAAFAPKPLGLTAADDWTKELATKGFPDLKRVWTLLGRPNDVTASFQTHWKHNYNHPSRVAMYGFMNRYFKLGGTEPVLERDFVVSTAAELTVWTKDHPAPAGAKVGGAHELALLKHWSEDSAALLQRQPAVRAQAWRIIVGRDRPAAGDLSLTAPAVESRGSYGVSRTLVRQRPTDETVSLTTFRPAAGPPTATVVWLARSVPTEPDAAMRTLLDAGIAVVVPQLYLPEAKLNPWVPVKLPKGTDEASGHHWLQSACYTYGYNPPLLVRRVHDVMTTVAALQSGASGSTRLVLVAGEGMGAVGALAAAVLPGAFQGTVIDTEGFRFAALRDRRHVDFVPGAVKYGDLPGLLSLSDATKLTVLGENGAPGGRAAVAQAARRWVR